MTSCRDAVLRFAWETFGTKPEYLWEKTPDCCVLRRADNRKWYGICMTVSKKVLGLPGEERVEILNVKSDYLTISFLRQRPGFLPAYHMNKEHWVTFLLDGTVEIPEICALLQDSYDLTQSKQRERKM